MQQADRLGLLKVRVKRHAGELRRSTAALFLYLLIFLGAELTSIRAHEYAIVIIFWHAFLLSTSPFNGTPWKAR
jgi:hypothetical protein